MRHLERKACARRRRAIALTAFFVLACAFGTFGSLARAESGAETVGTEAAQALRGYDKGQKKDARYQYVALGAYPQGENGEVAPIVWRVLAADDDRALLMSEYVLGVHPVHKDYEAYVDFGGEWTLTDAYAFLNGAFWDEAFAADEKALWDESEPLGRLFYPSASDLKNPAYGFPKSGGASKTRFALGTPWALKNGLFRYSLRKGGHSPYWTRTQSKTLPSGSNCTKVDGAVGYIRCIVDDVGFRPCGYVVTSRARVASGAGTLEDPYTFALEE